jgi:DnaJ-class molecular chaperone
MWCAARESAIAVSTADECRSDPNMEKTELNLEADCERCKGIGGREHFDKSWLICPLCNGSGKRPTPDGVKILQFLERHLPMDIFL